MEEIQTIEITKEEMEGLGEDFLLRMLRSLAMRADKRRLMAATTFLPDPLRKEMEDLISAGEGGFEEIRSQAKDGRNIFEEVGQTSEEKEQEEEELFKEMIEQQIKSRGSFQSDITQEIGSILGEPLRTQKIEYLILVCVHRGWIDMAKEASNSLPTVKRIQALTILSFNNKNTS